MSAPTTAPASRGADRLSDLSQLLESRYRLFAGLVGQNAEQLGPGWAPDLADTLKTLFADRSDLESAVGGYISFFLDIMRRQRRFERELTYPAKSYADAAEEVYLDFEYIMTEYLPGLLLSHYLWPHHYRLLQFFEMAFARPMQRTGATRFVEIGTGTGLYTRRLLQIADQAHGLTFDISPAAKAFAEWHLDAFGVGSRSEVRLEDVQERGLEPCSWLISVEVLEHLEDPLRFLRVLRSGFTDDGRAFSQHRPQRAQLGSHLPLPERR
jgi:hypothetical protein